MKIQLISNGDRKAINDPNITINPLSSPQSLDEFEVNIIDLSTPSLWCASAYNKNKAIDSINDFRSIQQMVDRKHKAFILYVLPANVDFDFYSKEICGIDKIKIKPLKDCLELVSLNISRILPSSLNKFSPKIFYENTRTKIEKIEYEANFCFDDLQTYDCWAYNIEKYSESIDSKKTTTIRLYRNIFLTTLQILESQKKLTNFINNLFVSPSEDEPEWVKNIAVLNDKELEQTIESKAQEIEQLKKEIEDLNSEKQENARIKSMLYTSGDKLVEVVFSILQKLLSYDLSEFVDEKREDFLIRKDGYTLIGEIKGVGSNIKNEHISQLELHYQSYKDELVEKGENENVHQILVVNPFRSKPLSERDPVNDKQIELANRNGCLMIETATLLKLYEKFVAGSIDVSGCEKLFTEKTGLLSDSDF